VTREQQRVAPKCRPPIGLDVTVHPWGTIKMIGWIGGERYYWLIGKRGCVSMMPAEVVEKRHER
jgi:hypothetical protein